MSELERIALAVLLALLYAAFTGFCYWRHHKAHGRTKLGAGQGDCIVAYASQSGRAHKLAEQTCAALGEKALLISLNRLSEQQLAACQQLFIIASTYGDGEAPDNGAAFAARFIHSSKRLDLGHLKVAVLALGDSHYADYCQFGRQLHAFVLSSSAKELAPLIELDAADPSAEHSALESWHNMLAQLGGDFSVELAEHAVIPEKHSLHLSERQCLNVGSPGQALYRLVLQARDNNALQFAAGDIAEVYPRQSRQSCIELLQRLSIEPDSVVESNSQSQTALEWLTTRDWREQPLPPPDASSDVFHQWLRNLPDILPRQYTIACASQPDRLELVVRQQRSEDGRLGLASGFLTQGAALGEKVILAIRDNRGFHTPSPEQPIILIGNGSGIAGLRAHIQHRAKAGGESCWLIYGERDPVADRPFAHEIDSWLSRGVLRRADFAYSRNACNPCYVQDRLREQIPKLVRWVDAGACIYVCGSREGMAQAVDQVLIDSLGAERLQGMQAEGFYRRDVY